MKKYILVSVFLLNFCFLLTAQEIKPGGKVDVGVPSVLKENEEGTYKLEDLQNELCPANKWGQNKKRSQKYWRVWSDRDNNVVYNDAGKGSIAKHISFGDPVIIAYIKGDMALVYNDDLGDDKWPAISSHPKLIGWIPMDHLLLWRKCPTDNYYVQRKALIAIHLNELGRNKKAVNSYYTSPDGESGMKALTMDMNFYFIMKTELDRALLCINPTVDNAGGNLFGWVDKAFYTEWNQRACLEANWDPDYVERRKGKTVGVYEGQEFRDNRLNFEYGKENGDPNPTNKYRWHPSFLRFPILDPIKDDAKWAHCTAFADPTTGKIGEFDGKAVEKINEVRKEKRQMNVIFVIEASNDMGQYFEAVKASLSKLKNYTSKNLNVKAGIVLYRSDATGNSKIETAKLDAPDDPLFQSMLSASKANGKFTGNIRTVALKQAIETAISPAIMGFGNNQSNLLVLVGNRGDAQDLADEAILKELKRNYIQIMSIQVVNAETGSSAAYGDQVKEMILKNMERQYGAITEEKENKTTGVKRRAIGDDGYLLSSEKKEESVYFSCALYPSNINDKYTGNDVTKWVDNGVRWFSETIDRWSAKFEKDISESGIENNYSKFLEEVLGKDLYKRIKKIGGIHAYDGYVPMKDSEEENYWHYIIYMSRDELQQLLTNLKPTYLAAREENDERDKYKEAVRALVKNMTGQNDDKQIDNMKMNELQEIVWGLNVSTGYSKRNLSEITDKSKVQRLEYIDILKKFVKKYENLDKILNGDYRYKTEFGIEDEFTDKNIYYWIPIEDLPLNDE